MLASQAVNVINLLGGRANIVKDVDACTARLHVTVKDAEKVGTEEQWKAERYELGYEGPKISSYLRTKLTLKYLIFKTC